MSNEKETFLFSDSMAFLALPGQPPIFERGKRPQGLSLAHLTSVPPTSAMEDFDSAYAAHCAFRTMALSNPNVHEVLTRGDVSRLRSTGILFGMQHTPKEMTFRRLHKLKKAGVRALILTYQKENEYGGGFTGQCGLTEAGKDMIEWMAECDILLDLSHANQKTASETLEFIEEEQFPMKPMVSHSGCSAIFPHSRNMSDDVMKDVAEKDGYIGIFLVNFFLGAPHTDYLENFFRHVQHAIEIAGENTIGIGSDCPHIDMTLVAAKEHYENMTKMLKTSGTFGEYFPDRPGVAIRHGSQLLEVLHSRLSEAYESEVAKKICNGNFKAYLERSLSKS